MLKSFSIGQAVMWDEKAGYQYGAIVDVIGDAIEIAPVFALKKGILCYDDNDANYADHRHNVRLKDCPPPFSFLCASVSSGQCFADGNLDKRYTISLADAARQMQLVEEDSLMTDRDVSEILYHPWPEQKEREKTFAQDARQAVYRPSPSIPFTSSVTDDSSYDGPDF